MKWKSIEPAEGAFDFAAADALVAFAKANHMRIRGHTLLWHEQNPAWLFKDSSGRDMTTTAENKALLLKRLENHIRAVVSHYKDDVYPWDVVNEVIDPKEPDGFRRTLWFQITGTDYIDTAFRTAHKIAPNAKLYINDYDTTDPAKRRFLYNLVRDLKSRGVPINGVGHHMHSNIGYPSADAIVETVNMFSGFGLDNQITELDISVYRDSTTRYEDVPEEILVQQGYRYRDLFQAFRKLKGKISAVTFCGMPSVHTCLNKFPIQHHDHPLLFHAQLQATPAYWGVVEPSRLPAPAGSKTARTAR